MSDELAPIVRIGPMSDEERAEHGREHIAQLIADLEQAVARAKARRPEPTTDAEGGVVTVPRPTPTTTQRGDP